MDKDEKLAKEFAEYQQIAKENKNVDVAALMINALSKQDERIVPSKSKRWAYLVSIGVPPFGLIFAFKYWFGDEEDGKQTAYICILLTIISLLVFYVTSKAMFSASGTSVEQIQQIKPQDALELVQ